MALLLFFVLRLFVVAGGANDEARTAARDSYLRWVGRSASLLKRLAPSQLVAVGGEGRTPFESYVNSAFDATHRLPAVDIVTMCAPALSTHRTIGSAACAPRLPST